MLIGKYTKMNDKYFEPRTDTGMKDADDQPLFIGDEVTLCGNPGMVFNDAAGPCVIIETDGHPEMWRLDIIHDKLKLVPRSATELSVLEFIRERFPVDCDWTGKNSYYFAVILNNKFKNSQIVLDTNTEKYMIYLSNQYYDYNGRIKDTSGMRLVIFDDENNPLPEDDRCRYFIERKRLLNNELERKPDSVAQAASFENIRTQFFKNVIRLMLDYDSSFLFEEQPWAAELREALEGSETRLVYKHIAPEIITFWLSDNVKMNNVMPRLLGEWHKKDFVELYDNGKPVCQADTIPFRTSLMLLVRHENTSESIQILEKDI